MSAEAVQADEFSKAANVASDRTVRGARGVAVSNASKVKSSCDKDIS